MQRRKRYGMAFLLVFLAAAAGFLAARSWAQSIEVPQITLPASVQQVASDLDVFSLLAGLLPAVTPAAQPTSLVVARTPQPVIVEGVESTATPLGATTTPLPSPTPSAPASEQVELPFALASEVRHSTDDCQGASIGGTVRDLAGNPLAGVRLWRYDQFGNEEVTESLSSDAERGQYRFSFGDTTNIHYLQVIDAGGTIISPVVEVAHRQGDAPDALCHWVDWRQQ